MTTKQTTACIISLTAAVIKEERLTTKLRVVFDASSHATGCPSFNDCLMKGPNFNPDCIVKVRTTQSGIYG